MAMQNPFIWGEGGQKMTPEQVAQKRALAALASQRAGDTSPVGHWAQGATRVVDALGGVLNERRANRGEEAGMAAADEWVAGNPVVSGLLGGGGSAAPMNAMGGDPFMPSSAPSMPADATGIRSGLIERGLPEHIADGFIMNFQDESGLNPGINEANPIVPGSRGGFGLYQLTGPRRRAYEQFAQQRGVPFADVDAQLDFLMTELQGPEAEAAQAIFSAPDSGTAAAAIVEKFLRPAEEHRARRVAEYTGGQGYTGGSYAPQPQQDSSVIAALAQGMSNPWVAQKYGPVIQSLMGNEMQRQNAQYDQQLRQQDPMYQMNMQKAQLELQQMRNPSAPEPIEVGGVLLDPTTYEPIFDSRTPDEGDGRYRPVGGQIWDFAPEGGGAPTLVGGGSEEVVMGPDGNPIFIRGPSGSTQRLTEGQSKDNVYTTRAEGALRALEGDGADPLTSRGEQMLGGVPFGLGRGGQSDEYQVAKQRGDEFLQAILRKDTGAAITEQEQQLYGQTYLPQPGDGPAVLAAKTESRARAVEAMKSGMNPSQIAATERAIIDGARRAEQTTRTQSEPDADGWQTINGVKIRVKQ